MDKVIAQLAHEKLTHDELRRLAYETAWLYTKRALGSDPCNEGDILKTFLGAYTESCESLEI